MKSNFLQFKLLVASLLLAGSLWAQTIKVTGTVTSQDDNQPLPGVSVVVKGKNIGTQTDAKGFFTLNANPGETLVLSYVGFTAQEVQVPESGSVDVALVAIATKMDEVVVTGYGTAKRSKLTSSIAKVDPKIMQTGVRANPAQALAGTVSGLRVTTGTGRPGSTPSIVLRGGTNFDGGGSPLVIMDGQLRASLADINPEEIESMEVLKDAAATAIYGARASNGVILITSKRGKAGTSAITLNTRFGINYMNVPYKFLDAGDYITWQRRGVVEAIKNGVLNATTLGAVGPRGTGNLYKDANGVVLDGNYDTRAVWSTMRLTDQNKELLTMGQGWKTMKDAVPTNPTTGAYDPNGTIADLIYKEFNYGQYAFNSPAHTKDVNLGMRGGNDKGKYFANLGLFNEDGLSLNTFYKRLNFAFNGDYKIREWLTSESGLQYSRANWRDESLQNGESNYWGRMLSAPPTMRGYNMKGEMLLGRDASDGNPAYNSDKYVRKNQTDKFVMNQAFRVDFTKQLYFRANAILMYEEAHLESFNRDFRTGVLSLTNPNTGWNRDRASAASFDRTVRQTYNGVLNYKPTFGSDHHLDAMVGFEYYDVYNNGLSAGGRLAPTDDFMDLALTLNTSETQTRSVDSWHNRERIISGFSRITYDYDNKYLATFTMRRDGYSRLIGNNQWGNFPAFSVGWLMHRENFMASTSNWLNFLRLRGSWGQNGNVGGIGIYELRGSYGSQPAYNGTIGFLQTGLANPSLKWEKSNTVEGGVDMGFLRNRLNVSVAVYDRITQDKIANVLLPTSSGVSSIRTNNGSMKNTGVEIDVNYKLFQNKDWSVQVAANAAWNKNRVLKLPYNGIPNNRQGGDQIYDPATGKVIWAGGLQEGQEWGQVFGYVSEGIIRNDKDLADYNKIDLAAGYVQYGGAAGKRVASQSLIAANGLTGFIATRLGDMKWKDIDDNDTIDYRDRVSLGRTLPRWTGGFNGTVSYKSLSLFFRIDYALGHVQQDFMQMWALGSFQGEFNATDLVKDTWTPQNPNAKYPRYTWADQLNSKNFDRPSSMFWAKSDYLAFREISLSYSLPKHIVQKAKMQAVAFTVTGQNLGYLSNSLLKLPERTGSQNSAYTIPTTLIFGANITF